MSDLANRRSRRFLLLLAVALPAALASLPAARGQGEDGDAGAIKFGVAGPMTGSGAVYGEMIRSAALLAQGELNDRGGVRGRRLEIEFGDDQGKNDQAVIVAKKLAGDPEISIVIGHFNSTCSIAGRETYKEAGVVEFSPGSTNVDVCNNTEWTFRNLYRDDYQGQCLARYVKNTLSLTRVAVFFDNDDYGKGLKDAFVAEAERLGLSIVAPPQGYIRERDSDFRTSLDTLAAGNPEVILISGLYEAAGTIIKQAREKGMKTPFLGGDGVFSPGLIEIAGEAAEGTLITTPFLFTETSSDEAKGFKTRFEEEYGRSPDTWAALTYDAVMQAAWVIEKVGPDRKAIRDYFASMTTTEKGYPGITGITYFDENGDCQKPLWVALVKYGEFDLAPKQVGQ